MTAVLIIFLCTSDYTDPAGSRQALQVRHVYVQSVVADVIGKLLNLSSEEKAVECILAHVKVDIVVKSVHHQDEGVDELAQALILVLILLADALQSLHHADEILVVLGEEAEGSLSGEHLKVLVLGHVEEVGQVLDLRLGSLAEPLLDLLVQRSLAELDGRGVLIPHLGVQLVEHGLVGRLAGKVHDEGEGPNLRVEDQVEASDPELHHLFVIIVVTKVSEEARVLLVVTGQVDRYLGRVPLALLGG
jgi:hypothetical protein